VLPHIVAGAPGKVDVAYYHGVKSGSTLKWYSMAAQSLNALSGAPAWTNVQLSNVVVEPNQTASALMGACFQGQQATLNGLACGRAADVYGISLDKCGGLVLAWPAQANQRTDGTYATQQTGGPKLLSVCDAPGVTKSGRTPSSSGDRTSTGASGSLASTGSSRWVAVAALGLLLIGGLLARRRFLP